MILLKTLKNGILRLNIIKTALGWSGLIRDDESIYNFYLPYKNKTALLATLEKEVKGITVDMNFKQDKLIFEIKKYFFGEKLFLNYKLNLSGCTPFQIDVYKMAMIIPYGNVKTYSWISKAIKKPGSQRAVGNALSKNPIPLFIPCHRVIKSNGALGGFSADRGPLLKKEMLNIESQTLRSCLKIEFIHK